jgi:acyl carrier protein
MIPAAFEYVDALPLNAHGKLDRRALPSIDWSRPGTALTSVPPRSAEEEQMAAIWGRVLGVERVGVHDNFFELGGHSLKAMQVLAAVRKEFAADLPVRALFETPTVAGLVARIGLLRWSRAAELAAGAQASQAFEEDAI